MLRATASGRVEPLADAATALSATDSARPIADHDERPLSDTHHSASKTPPATRSIAKL